METFTAVFLFVLMLVCALYVFIMALLISGWISLPKFLPSNRSFNTTVSVIIPARNEERNIEACLHSIASQDLPPRSFEVIVVDDHSEDTTAQLVRRFMESTGVSVRLLKSDGAGKKAALRTGIRSSSSQLIITTDADTVHHKGWLRAMISFYEAHKLSMIIGPVAYMNEASFFEKLQSLEIAGLVAAGGAAAQLGMPMMCNGANLAFTREAFDAAEGYGDSQLASGDDVMLMSRIHNEDPAGIRFIRAKEAVVHTRACKSFREFFSQRVRWAAKNRAAYSSASLGTAIIVFLMNLMLLVGFVLSIFYSPLLLPLLILLSVKCVIDFLFLFLAAAFSNKKGLLLFFVPALLWIMLYVSITGFLSLQRRYSWKGREQR